MRIAIHFVYVRNCVRIFSLRTILWNLKSRCIYIFFYNYARGLRVLYILRNDEQWFSCMMANHRRRPTPPTEKHKEPILHNPRAPDLILASFQSRQSGLNFRQHPRGHDGNTIENPTVSLKPNVTFGVWYHTSLCLWKVRILKLL